MHIWDGNIKRYLTETEVVFSDSGWGVWAGFCKHCNKNLGYIKGGEFLV
jgi:hypothetical protein